MHFRRVKGTTDLLKMTLILVVVMFIDSDLLYLSIPNGRHLLGEQLDSLTIKELQQLEQQLDSSLKHIRSRKVNKLGLNLLFGAQLIWLFTNVLVNYYIIALFFWVQNQLMFDSISELQKKVSYTLDSLVPRILYVLHESLVKIIVTSTPLEFGE